MRERSGLKIPDYAFDCHMQKGRRMGKMKEKSFRDERVVQAGAVTHGAGRCGE